MRSAAAFNFPAAASKVTSKVIFDGILKGMIKAFFTGILKSIFEGILQGIIKGFFKGNILASPRGFSPWFLSR